MVVTANYQSTATQMLIHRWVEHPWDSVRHKVNLWVTSRYKVILLLNLTPSTVVAWFLYQQLNLIKVEHLLGKRV
jgi:amino acid permease